MAENKMEQVAAMFGKDLGEEFKVKWEGIDGKIYHALYHFSNLGIIKGQNDSDVCMLNILLTGKAEIEEDKDK